MEHTYWIKQSDEPAFPDLIWGRPENRNARGKLLIIGGNSFGFSAPGQAYKYSEDAGIGTARVLLPVSVKKVAGTIFPAVEFAASNPSGSFGQLALADWLEHSQWADGVILAGDLGRNSETAILIEKYLNKSTVPLIITKDAADYFLSLAKTFVHREDTTLVLTMAQLQKLGVHLGFAKPFKVGMELMQLVELMHELTSIFKFEFIAKHHTFLIVAANASVSTTALEPDREFWRTEVATYAAVWRLQNPANPFEALTTAMFDYVNNA